MKLPRLQLITARLSPTFDMKHSLP